MIAAITIFALTFAAAGFGSLFLPGAWYETIAKPAWTPPNWLFGPVWTLLYIMMAVAAWLVYRKTQSIGLPLTLWFVQLVLNALWSWFFFGLERPGAAFAEITILLLAIVATVVVFLRVDTVAGLLLVPYLAWVSFASALNFAIWQLNTH
ncbi:MAG: TspO/MBR family protein [Gammaproteobacteria bacterium]